MQKDSVFYASNLFAEINSYNLAQKRLKEEETSRFADEKKRKKESERLIEEKRKQKKAEVKLYKEEIIRKDAISTITQFDPQLLNSYTNDFGYLRQLNPSEIAELKPVLLSAPKDNYQALFCLGQLYIQEKTSASNLKLAYNAIKTASKHGIYEAGAYMAYFYLYGKVVTMDLDEAERRINIDNDFKKNPIFVQMMIDLYTQKGNSLLANVWKSKLETLKQ